MTTPSSLDAVMGVLGPPAPQRARTADAWREIESDLGFTLPDDYKIIVDAYAPVRLYEHLYLHHPTTEHWNLRRWMSETITAWSAVDWEEEIDGDPREVLGTAHLRFGTPDGLTPLVESTRGETIFFARNKAGAPVIFAENGQVEFYCQAVPFSEWLRQYLNGENAVGPGSGIFYPGPVKFTSLPMTPQAPQSEWYGPDRGK
ncbi:SMI1/KNR4 family protein [Streptomyces bacillaris]|uniref:SMI1/KNR4 family protein n=1 Tax=Streptomyces bacillaris TaxID=68179 RepID=UPI00365C926C